MSIIKIIISKGKIRTVYNFGNKQNPEIDKLFNRVLGKNVYFIREEPEKTIYITSIYSSLTLKVKLKMYTDSTELIDSFNTFLNFFFIFSFFKWKNNLKR